MAHDPRAPQEQSAGMIELRDASLDPIRGPGRARTRKRNPKAPALSAWESQAGAVPQLAGDTHGLPVQARSDGLRLVLQGLRLRGEDGPHASTVVGHQHPADTKLRQTNFYLIA